VSATNIAAVDPQFMRTWENGRYVTIVRDKTPVTGGKRVLFRAPMGAVFPTIGEDAERTWIWTAVRDARGRRFSGRRRWQKSGCRQAVPFTPPCRASRPGACRRTLRLGGLGGKRDCSAMIRDLFAPSVCGFPAIPASRREPENSPPSATFLPRKGGLIVREGAPWRTLLWTPGHIMLYIGVHQGKPLIFHNFWSIKTQDADGKKDGSSWGVRRSRRFTPAMSSRALDLPRSNPLWPGGNCFLGEPPSDDVTNLETKP